VKQNHVDQAIILFAVIPVIEVYLLIKVGSDQLDVHLASGGEGAGEKPNQWLVPLFRPLRSVCCEKKRR